MHNYQNEHKQLIHFLISNVWKFNLVVLTSSLSVIFLLLDQDYQQLINTVFVENDFFQTLKELSNIFYQNDTVF